MTDAQLTKFIEMLRLEKIDINAIENKPNDYNAVWPFIVMTFRAVPVKIFYDDDEWKFLKEIGLVKE